MDIAIAKRKENIAEYILYLWQIEDLLRALQFSPEAVYSQFVKPRHLPAESENIYLSWYMDIANLLRQENKEEKGHLDHTLHLIADVNDLHLRLLKLPIGQHYRETFSRLEPYLPTLRERLGKDDVSDIEICFRALYAAMLYRIKHEADSAVQDTVEYVSPVIAELSALYGKVERGEIDLFKGAK